MKIGILNAYDARNLGDFAIVLAQKAWLQRFFPDAEFRIFSHHFKENAPLFGGDSVESILHVPPYGPIPAKLFLPALDWLRYHLCGHDRIPKFREFDDCDFYVLCGGGYLYSSQNPLISRNLHSLCLIGLMAVKTGKFVLQFPQSYGPITRFMDDFIVTKLAKALPVAVPRSECAMNYLRNRGLEDKAVVIPDIAVSLRILFPEKFSTEYRRSGLGIAPIDYGFAMRTELADEDRYVEKMVGIASDFHRKTGENITLFQQVTVAGKDDDSVTAKRICEALRKIGVPVARLKPPEDFWDYMAEFRKVRVFIGCRMHSCIFSLLGGTPTIGLAYQPKFFGLFEQFGFGEWVCPIDKLDPEWALTRIRDFLQNESAIQNRIVAASDAIALEIDQKLNVAFGKDLARLRDKELIRRTAGSESPSFSIVTPSYKQLKWLKLSARSVADQAGVTVEHIIQDAQTGPELNEWVATNTSAKLFVESDDGMYDAINRGFRKASGDIVAWLNCDEQYLPGALERVGVFFKENPGIDVLFCDALLIGEKGEILSYRRAILPQLLHIQLSHLNILSCATFVRRSVLERGFYLDRKWKAIADAVWVAEMLKSNLRMAVLNEPLAAFTITQTNLGQSSLAKSETKRWQQSVLAPAQFWLRIPIIVLHRVRKFFGGAYFVRTVETSLYTQDSPAKRRLIEGAKVSFTWMPSTGDEQQSIFRNVLGEILNTFKQVHASAFDPENFMSGEVKKDRSESWGSIVSFLPFPAILAMLTLFIDSHITTVVLTPMVCTVFLFGVSMFFKPRQTAACAVVFFAAVFISLRWFPPQPHGPLTFTYWLQLTIRSFGFSVVATIAVFASMFRTQSLGHLNEIFTILNRIPTPVVVSDAAGFVVFVNNDAAHFLEAAKSEVLGTRYVKLFMGNQDEGSAMRFYIQFFEGEKQDAENAVLAVGESQRAVAARLICIGEGTSRYLVTALSTPSNKHVPLFVENLKI